MFGYLPRTGEFVIHDLDGLFFDGFGGFDEIRKGIETGEGSFARLKKIWDRISAAYNPET